MRYSFAIAPAFNTKLVAREDAPRSALDFLKPMFRGKLITAYPNDDDATLFAFQTIVKKYGWKYMDDYMATEPKFIQGHLGVVRSVGAGESLANGETGRTPGNLLALLVVVAVTRGNLHRWFIEAPIHQKLPTTVASTRPTMLSSNGDREGSAGIDGACITATFKMLLWSSASAMRASSPFFR